MAMAAAAKLPIFFTSATGAAALPVEELLDPDAVCVADGEPVMKPKLEAAAVPEADVTIVVVQEQSEL